MYTIIHKEPVSPTNKLMVIEAPAVARKAQPGQFVIVRVDERGERIPLTIADYDPQAGTVTLIFQEVGKSTMQMGLLKAGDALRDLVGPLGNPTEIEYYGTVICVGGGVAIAPIAPIARALKAAGNEVISIIGARSREFLFWESRMRAASDELLIVTDDGSYGRQGWVTAPLQELLEARGDAVQRVWAIGPAPMMQACAETTRPFGVPTLVSLNTVMIDGTGMCGGCRVGIGDEIRFVCVDGPEFDGHQVDWEMLIARQAYYQDEEEEAVEAWEHTCRLTEKEAEIAEAYV